MSYKSRGDTCISQGCLTNSKHATTLIEGLYPSHVKGGHGCFLYDVNDRKYTDFICGLGTNLLGYGNDLVSREMMKHLYTGFSHSLPTVHEVHCAEKIKEIFPFVDLVKFLKSGSEACSAAIKIARGVTGRTNILTDHYHGWHDVFTHLVPPAIGTEKCQSLPLGENAIDDTIAAVIIEPIVTDYSSERFEYLKDLREKCTKHGVVLIFDEIITGFRFKKHGVCNESNITPDLLLLGKSIANGMPLAAVCGKKELMSDRSWFVSSTYAGEILSLVAATKTMSMLQANSDYSVIRLWDKGQEFLDKFNAMPSSVKIVGYPSRGVFVGDPKEIAIFFQEMAKASILFCKSWFFNFDLIEQADDVLSIAKVVLERIENKTVKLQYPAPRTPFAQKQRS